jgi:XTP/dITP diphosphohydrolase
VHKLKELKKINSILIATNNPGKFKEIKDLLPKKIKTIETGK